MFIPANAGTQRKREIKMVTINLLMKFTIPS